MTVYKPGFPHFAGINPAVSTTKYAFQVLPELCLRSYNQAETGYFPYPPYGDTCVGGSDSYGRHDGIGVTTTGSTFIVGYDGQYASWGDQFYHYNDDGLLIGQFGNSPYYDLTEGAGQAPPASQGLRYTPGVAGNIAQLEATWPDQDGTIYVYHTDEGHFGGIHRWTISNVNSVTEKPAIITAVSIYDESTSQ